MDFEFEISDIQKLVLGMSPQILKANKGAHTFKDTVSLLQPMLSPTLVPNSEIVHPALADSQPRFCPWEPTKFDHDELVQGNNSSGTKVGGS